MYELSKPVPSRKKVVIILQAKRDFMQMSPRYREIREKSRNPMCSCFWCGHKFADGEMMGLVIPEKGKNKVLCNSCFDNELKERT